MADFFFGPVDVTCESQATGMWCKPKHGDPFYTSDLQSHYQHGLLSDHFNRAGGAATNLDRLHGLTAWIGR